MRQAAKTGRQGAGDEAVNFAVIKKVGTSSYIVLYPSGRYNHAITTRDEALDARDKANGWDVFLIARAQTKRKVKP